jgi:hypothetical protein
MITTIIVRAYLCVFFDLSIWVEAPDAVSAYESWGYNVALATPIGSHLADFWLDGLGGWLP